MNDFGSLESHGWRLGNSLARLVCFLALGAPLFPGLARAKEVGFEPPPWVKLHEDTERETRYLGVVMVSDTKAVAAQGGAPAARERARQLVDGANRIFARAGLTPRLRVVLVDHLVFESDPYTLGSSNDEVDGAALLSAFNSWASGASLAAHDVHVLITGSLLSGSDVGVTALGGACLNGYNGLVVQYGTSLDSPLEQTLVHEVGHLLGMQHDGASNGCSSSGYLMSAIASPGGLSTPRFSDCSRAEFADFLDDFHRSRCTSDVPTLITNSICGDGVRSGNEACDCGDTESCEEIDPCCRSDCSLAFGAVCSSFNDGNSCCSESCQIAPAGDICRPSRDACDAAEECSGTSSRCPGDSWPRSGTACEDATGVIGACFRGACVSRTAQCLEVASEVGVELAAPKDTCGHVDDPCGEAVCWYVTTSTCLPTGRAVSDGVPCGSSSQCSSGQCVVSSEIDECPNSAMTIPGECGCEEIDSDEDGDGVVSCLDACPRDARKVLPAICGCGVTESDDCPVSVPGTAGASGGDNNGSEGKPDGNGGCSCCLEPTSSHSAWWLAITAACAFREARRRARTMRDGMDG